jgi:alpha-L-fucosidase
MGEKGERRQKKGFADQRMMEWGEGGSRETGNKRRWMQTGEGERSEKKRREKEEEGHVRRTRETRDERRNPGDKI